MSNSAFLAGSFVVAWLMSPEALVLASNLAGVSGPVITLITFGATLVSYLALIITYYQGEQGDVAAGEEIVLHSFALAAAVTLAIFLPTGMLVTAGFTFNETFLYWFPNFGFSAIILFAILLIQLAGELSIKIAQRLFSSITAIGLFTIILVGLLSQAGTPPEPFNPSEETNYFTPFALTLLLLLGSWHPGLRGISPAQLFFILFGGALLIGLWQLVALEYVPGARLANSTIPIASRATKI